MTDAYALLDDLAAEIADNRASLEAGKDVAMDALVTLAEQLHSAAEGVPQAERAALAARMGDVAVQLAILEEELRMRKGEVAEELYNLAQVRRANLAYLRKPEGEA